MRKLLTFGSILLFLTLASVPKAYSQVELFGGYSRLQLSGAPSTSSNGWAGGAYLHLLGPWGIEADYSKHYGVSSVTALTSGGHPYYVPGFTQLYGPRFTLALPKVHPYVHALFGTVNGEATAPFTGAGLTEKAFGMAFGGGLNVKATGRIWVRLIQVDYLRAQFTNNAQNDMRISAGLVFRFGNW
ncbi:MAG TPA: outer membrane beta-barrel protein [Terriglobia bacterium]|nr:outer membrane beta-barrel protein [Terriglobia bacterium]